MSLLRSERIHSTLLALYEDAYQRTQETKKLKTPRSGLTPEEQFELKKKAYMAISYECGELLYGLARSNDSKNIVEFGMSFGLSTLFLATALKENQGHKIITTEYFQEKADQALQNFERAGLSEMIECRVGDALETLSTNLPEQVDFLFLDGAKSLYGDILKMVEPRLRKGSLVVSDNTNHKGMEEHLAYLRDPANGYTSTAINTLTERAPGHHEISIKL